MAELMGLGGLLAPLDPEVFFSDYWEQAHLLLCRDTPDFYRDVLTITDIDDFLQSNRVPASLVKAVKDGEPHATGDPAPGDRTLGNRRGAGSSADQDRERFVDHSRLYAAFAEDGATIVIDGGHQAIPSLTRFCARIESQLRFRVQANLYITPPGTRGLRPHHDTHDVMILQIAGAKQWRLFGSSGQALPLARARGAERAFGDEQVEHRLSLNAGDLLYLPRGVIHDARTSDSAADCATGSASVHISLGLRPDLRLDLARELIETAAERVYFRRALPHPYCSEDQIAAFKRGFASEIAALVEQMDVDQLMQNRSANFVDGQLREREGLFADLLHLTDLTADSVVVRRTGLDAIIDRQQSEIKVRFGVHEVGVPSYLESSLSQILQPQPFAIGELPGMMTMQGKIDLIRQFVRTGLLRIDHV